MDWHTTVAVVILLCVLGGCSAFGGENNPAGETVTPAPVPTVAPEYASGVSPDGVNGYAVARAHVDAIASSSYTRRTKIRWRTWNGSTYNGSIVHRIAPEGNQFRISAEYAYPRGSADQTGYELWYDGDRTYVRRSFTDGAVEYSRFDYPPDDGYPRPQFIGAIFSRLVPGRVAQASDGATIVGGKIRDVSGLAEMPMFSHEDNGTMTARLSPAGYLDRAAIGFDAIYQGRPVHVRLVVDFADVGSTNVSEPEWMAERQDANDSGSIATPAE